MKITDTQRLDFVQKLRALLDASCYQSEVSPCVVFQGGAISQYGKDVRGAIDAAIRASRKKSPSEGRGR